jgi:hypothetical protein
MSQIQTGSVSVTTTSATVIADLGNDWSEAKAALSFGTPVYFSLIGDLEIPRQVYAITDPSLSSSGFWELTLIAPWQGASGTGLAYIIHKDFTINRGLPIFSPQDRQTAQLMARMVQILDTTWPMASRVVLPTDLAGVASTTLVNATGLVLPIAVGGPAAVRALFIFDVVWNSTATGTGIKLGLTYPSAAVFAATVHGSGIALDGTAAEFTGTISSSGDSVTLPSCQTAGTDYVAEIRGVIVPSLTGQIQLQYAASTTASGTVSIRQGSNAMFL